MTATYVEDQRPGICARCGNDKGIHGLDGVCPLPCLPSPARKPDFGAIPPLGQRYEKLLLRYQTLSRKARVWRRQIVELQNVLRSAHAIHARLAKERDAAQIGGRANWADAIVMNQRLAAIRTIIAEWQQGNNGLASDYLTQIQRALGDRTP